MCTREKGRSRGAKNGSQRALARSESVKRAAVARHAQTNKRGKRREDGKAGGGGQEMKRGGCALEHTHTQCALQARLRCCVNVAAAGVEGGGDCDTSAGRGTYAFVFVWERGDGESRREEKRAVRAYVREVRVLTILQCRCGVAAEMPRRPDAREWNGRGGARRGGGRRWRKRHPVQTPHDSSARRALPDHRRWRERPAHGYRVMELMWGWGGERQSDGGRRHGRLSRDRAGFL